MTQKHFQRIAYPQNLSVSKIFKLHQNTLVSTDIFRLTLRLHSMKKHCFTSITLCILLASAISIGSANAATPSKVQATDRLYTILLRRVDLMKWIALDKWRNHKPIEDLPREKVVLQKTRQQAAAVGVLDIDTLTRAQIQIAKNEQQRWMDKWKKTPPSKNSPAPSLSELRTELNELSSELMIALKESIPSLHGAKRQVKLRALLDHKLEKLPTTERQILWTGLLKLQLKTH
ncbi:MAG: hypothetical protein ABI210_13335 [Abditibacteriaceae bacterium]